MKIENEHKSYIRLHLSNDVSSKKNKIEREIFTYSDEIFSVIQIRRTEEEANKVETKTVL
jgi:hypothetical protein